MPNKSPTIFVSFLATFSTLVLLYVAIFVIELREVVPAEAPSKELVYISLVMMALTALRHQVRILHVDSLYVLRCKDAEVWRREFWLIWAITIMAGAAILVRNTEQSMIASYMLVYSVLFGLLGASVLRRIYVALGGFRQTDSDDNMSIAEDIVYIGFSLVVDLILVAAWFSVVLAGYESEDSFQHQYVMILLLALLFLGEYLVSYRPKVASYWSEARKLMIG